MDYKEKVIALLNSQELSKEQKEKLEEIFPELRKSEDEMIRGAIIDHLKDYNLTEWADWLEKQGDVNRRIQEEIEKQTRQEWKPEIQCDQNFIDKYEPKFHKGDWAVSNLDGNARQISEVHFDEYNSYYVVDGKSVNLKEYDRLHHHWSIKDARPGDVLYCKSLGVTFIMILKCINQNRSLDSYCRYNTIDGFGVDVPKVMSINDDPKPATKEQCRLLLKKMNESGYMWNSKKKELKKIDDEEVNGEDYGIDGLWHAQRILEKTLGEVDGYQTDDGILDHKAAITAVKKLYEAKPDWTEDDKEMLNTIIADVSRTLRSCGIGTDEHTIRIKAINFLESLKRRYTWKPSDEQLEALWCAAEKYLESDDSNVVELRGKVLESLYNELKDK